MTIMKIKITLITVLVGAMVLLSYGLSNAEEMDVSEKDSRLLRSAVTLAVENRRALILMNQEAEVKITELHDLVVELIKSNNRLTAKVFEMQQQMNIPRAF